LTELTLAAERWLGSYFPKLIPLRQQQREARTKEDPIFLEQRDWSASAVRIGKYEGTFARS